MVKTNSLNTLTKNTSNTTIFPREKNPTHSQESYNANAKKLQRKLEKVLDFLTTLLMIKMARMEFPSANNTSMINILLSSTDKVLHT